MRGRQRARTALFLHVLGAKPCCNEKADKEDDKADERLDASIEDAPFRLARHWCCRCRCFPCGRAQRRFFALFALVLQLLLQFGYFVLRFSKALVQDLFLALRRR